MARSVLKESRNSDSLSVHANVDHSSIFGASHESLADIQLHGDAGFGFAPLPTHRSVQSLNVPPSKGVSSSTRDPVRRSDAKAGRMLDAVITRDGRAVPGSNRFADPRRKRNHRVLLPSLVRNTRRFEEGYDEDEFLPSGMIARPNTPCAARAFEVDPADRRVSIEMTAKALQVCLLDDVWMQREQGWEFDELSGTQYGQSSGWDRASPIHGDVYDDQDDASGSNVKTVKRNHARKVQSHAKAVKVLGSEAGMVRTT